MPSRSFSASSYKYGFNGKEKDDEIKGDGNSVDFGDRMFDPRLGKWLSTDPLQTKYPDLSPYNFVANNPLRFVDPNGQFLLDVHQRITTRTFFGVKWKSAFSNDAERITFQDGVRGTGGMLSGGITHPDVKQGEDHTAHFDCMNFTQIIHNSERIQQKTSSAVSQFNQGNMSSYELGFEVGKNLHAIQDLYSHSNYVELYAQVYGETKLDEIPTLNEAFADKKYSEFAAVLKTDLRTGEYPATGKGSHQDMNHDLGEGASVISKNHPKVKEQIKGKKVDWFSKAAEAVATKASKEYLNKTLKKVKDKK